MTTGNYTNTDAQIIKAIRDGHTQFTQILTAVSGEGPIIDFRIVDRRLQSMRKRNLISYAGRAGWRILKETSQ